MSLESVLQTEEHILSQGSVFLLLKHSPEVVFDDYIFHAGLIYDERAAEVLAQVYRSYIDIAVAAGLPMAVSTATWRANKDRIKASAFADRAVNEDNARFMDDLRNSYTDSGIPILVKGDIGPRGDAYKPEEALDVKSARDFHSYQVERLASQNIDCLTASTLPAVSEATGIALAMAGTGKPYALSFVVGRDGRVLDGTMLGDAMKQIDDTVGDDSARYAVNCVHPSVLHLALDQNPEAEGRILSFSGNTSDLNPEELDALETLETQEPRSFALVNQKLLKAHHIPILGACCGSGPEHIKEMAGFLAQR